MWKQIKEDKIIKGENKSIGRMIKSTETKSSIEVVDLITSMVPHLKKHLFQMYYQAKQLKNLKENPKDNEILFQVDFSQNYVAKHSTEVQSLHFGASQKQISLYTAAKYVKLNNQVSFTTFCTVSDQLDHQAHGVWSHLKQILTGTV